MNVNYFLDMIRKSDDLLMSFYQSYHSYNFISYFLFFTIMFSIIFLINKFKIVEIIPNKFCIYKNHKSINIEKKILFFLFSSIIFYNAWKVSGLNLFFILAEILLATTLLYMFFFLIKNFFFKKNV